MGLKESLRDLRKKERLSVKREVKKELTRLKKTKKKEARCLCGRKATHFLKGTNHGYCRDCAKEFFGDLAHLEKK